MKHRHSFLALLVLFQALIVGFTNIAAKQAAMEIDPFVVSFFRYLIGTITLAAILLAKGGSLHVEKTDLKPLFLLMFTGVLCNQILFAQALRYTLPSHPPMIYALTPVVIIFIDILRKKEPASGKILAASLLAFIGVGIVLGRSILIFNASILLGDGLVFIAMLFWSVYTIFSKPFVHRYGPLQLALILIIGALVLYTPWGVIRLAQADVQALTWKGWLSIVYLGIFSSGFSYLNYFAILKRIRPSQTGLIISTHPPVTLILSVFLGFEVLQWNMIAGSLLIILALWIAQRRDTLRP